ncbi:2'-5' RNA ligase family protein [Roseivirga sp.]|uniref:2'-5' RNA ligase family protein n=1 Tax=Roseivirga sp. TaxID=1964215 RepID=UPI003B8A9F88
MKPNQRRYFLALIPPEPLQSEVLQIKDYFLEKYDSKGALRSPGHITLHMPFLWRADKEEKLKNLLVHATKESSFTIQLDGFDCFVPRSIFIKNKKSQELIDFQKRLSNYTKRSMNLFNSTHNKGFHPHMTVAFRDLKKEKFNEAWSEFESKSFQADFKVDSFWLLKHDGKVWEPYHEFQFEA